MGETAKQATTTHSRPRQAGSTPPSRRSFRLTGGAPDPGCGHAMLPLWLEESSGATFPATFDSVVQETDQDSSFEKRWDSLRNKSKIHSSCQTQKPPSWDDVTHSSARVKKDKKSSFRPSIVIQEPSRAWPATAVCHKFPAPPASGRCRTASQQTHGPEARERNSLSMREFSEQVNEIFSDDFLQIPVQHASSTSSLGSESSTSEGEQLFAFTSDVAQQSSSTTGAIHQFSSTSYGAQQPYCASGVIHQLSSTSHVPQQCFSKSAGTQQLASTSPVAQQSSSVTCDTQPSTSNMPQQSCCPGSAVLESSSNASDCHMWLSSDSFLCEDFTSSDAAENPEPEPHQSPFCPSVLETANPETRTVIEPEEEEEVQLSASSSLCRLSENARPIVSLSCSSEAATLRVADVPRRQHWVQFDGGPTEQWTPQVVAPLEIVPSAPPPDTYSSPGEFPLRPPSPASMPNVMIREKPRASPTHAGNYSGRLIRSYSQRGRRASKRVINSVSRRMSVTDYGRLSESQPPMYSKAVMTMQSGPGLFEKALESTESERLRDEEKRFQAEELKMKPPTSFLEEPISPRRVGSVRAPRMSGTLLRRSVSLNSSRRETSDMPFRRLSEQRPGSFRKALGALARSFRRKSSSANKQDIATNENSSVTQDRLNTGPAVTHAKQTPQAPRLPRRAARQSYSSTHDWNRPAQFV